MNQASFSMINDLRDDDGLYEFSAASIDCFLPGTRPALASTLSSTTWIEFRQQCPPFGSDFLQQLFTLIFMIFTVILTGGKMAWVLLLFCAGHL